MTKYHIHKEINKYIVYRAIKKGRSITFGPNLESQEI